MAEYIERETIKEKMIHYGFKSPDMTVTEFVEDELPAADVAPVRHGRWAHKGPRFRGGVDWWHCSNCHSLASGAEIRFRYCPYCGARMDGAE